MASSRTASSVSYGGRGKEEAMAVEVMTHVILISPLMKYDIITDETGAVLVFECSKTRRSICWNRMGRIQAESAIIWSAPEDPC